MLFVAGQDCAAKDSKMILEELKQVLCQDFPEVHVM